MPNTGRSTVCLLLTHSFCMQSKKGSFLALHTQSLGRKQVGVGEDSLIGQVQDIPSRRRLLSFPQRWRRKVVQTVREFSDSYRSVTNIPGHPEQQSVQHASRLSAGLGLFLLQRAIWVNEHREEASAEPALPRLLGPANTRGFDACREQQLSLSRMLWLLLAPQGRPCSGGHG